jgi:hypothetical protein
MNEEPKTYGQRWATALKILSIICGLMVIGLAIYKLTRLSLSVPMSIILPIYYIGFGCLIISIEFGVGCIMKNLLLLKGYCGRGVFYILIGILCIHEQTIFEYVVASSLGLVGIIYMCCLCGQRDSNYTNV